MNRLIIPFVLIFICTSQILISQSDFIRPPIAGTRPGRQPGTHDGSRPRVGTHRHWPARRLLSLGAKPPGASTGRP